MRDVLKALNRHESVTLLYLGKKKGKIIPLTDEIKSRDTMEHISDHPFLGWIKEIKIPLTIRWARSGGHVMIFDTKLLI